MQRVEMLVSQARAIAPDAEGLLNLMIQWYRKLERNQEAMAVAEDFIRRFPNNFLGYASLATSKIFAGHAEEAIPLEEKAIQLNPRSSYLFNRYRQLGFASLLLGRDKDAITFLERSLAINPDDDGGRQWIYRFLAAAYAQSGQLAAAKHAVAEADRLWPYDTVRSHWPDDLSSHVYAEQVRRLQAGLRLVGERDHADEEADFGVPSDATLRNDFAGLTPTAAPGARTIRTTDLAKFLVLARPVVIDTVSYSWGRSIARCGWSEICRFGWQPHRPCAGSPAQQDARADGWRSQQADCRGRLELRTLRRTQSGAAPGRARLHAGLLVPRGPGGLGGGGAARDRHWRCRTGDFSRQVPPTPAATYHPSDRAFDQPSSCAISCRSCFRCTARRS